MSSRQPRTSGARSAAGNKPLPATKKNQKAKKPKTVQVAITRASKRALAASSSRRSQAAAGSRSKGHGEKNVASEGISPSVSKTDKSAAGPVNAAGKRKHSSASKKAALKKVAKRNSGAVGEARSNATAPTRSASPSLIPAPTQEVLRPFREAAKRTKKLQKDRVKAAKSRGDFLAKQTRKGKKYKIDLRVHTPGSYGYFSTGGVDPAPALVRLARVKGLDMIGVTDYYNAAYVDEVRHHAEAAKIVVLPGFDMCCRVDGSNQITAIALFPPSHSGADITRVLNELQVPVAAYGRPDYVLEPDFAEVIACIERHGGVLIPSRVDKTPFRRMAIPTLVEQFGFHAFDLVHSDNPDYFRENWPSGGFTFFSFSNANALGQVGNRSVTVKMSSASFDGLKELVARRIDANGVPTVETIEAVEDAA